MSNYLLPALAYGAIAAGAVATGVQVFVTVRRTRAAMVEVQRLAQHEELQVLQSNDIKRLGSYLYENIGSTRISNYVENKEVRARVSRALDSILDFLGTEVTEINPEESAEAVQETRDDEAIRVLEEPEQEDLSEMQKALQEITYGEAWNGLARMRRHIEVQLRDIVSERPQWQRLPLGRLLVTLRQAGYISDRAEKLLRYAINVANAGIHGDEIGVGQAQEAWEAAVRGLTMVPPQSPSADTEGP